MEESNPRWCPEVCPMGAGCYGDLLVMVAFGLQPHWHPETGDKGTSGVASAPVPGNGSRTSALLPPQLGPPAAMSSSAKAVSYWVILVTLGNFPDALGAVSWAAPRWSVSLHLPPLLCHCHLILPWQRQARRAGHRTAAQPPHCRAGCSTSPAVVTATKVSFPHHAVNATFSSAQTVKVPWCHPLLWQPPSSLPSLAPSCGSAHSLLACEVFLHPKPESDIQPSSDTTLSQPVSRNKSCSPRITPGFSRISPMSPLCTDGTATHPSSTAIGLHPYQHPLPRGTRAGGSVNKSVSAARPAHKDKMSSMVAQCRQGTGAGL